MNARAEPPQRILVADDDRHIAELVRMYLAKAGYDVTVARDGNETCCASSPSTWRCSTS
jgi:PleD family two-component response regulator